jgi:hypothetical protein
MIQKVKLVLGPFHPQGCEGFQILFVTRVLALHASLVRACGKRMMSTSSIIAVISRLV